MTGTFTLRDQLLRRFRALLRDISAESGPETSPPAAPTGLTANPGDGLVSLDWNDNGEPDLASYNVKRGTSAGGPYATIATGVSASAHDDSVVTNGTTYYYVVSAVDTSANESGNSSEASATPVPDTSVLYFSLGTNGTVGAVSAANEDVIAFDGTTFSLYFDGSDIGLGGLTTDALDVISGNEILMSSTASGSVPGSPVP